MSFADAPWTVLRNRRDWRVDLGWWAPAFMKTIVARRIEEGLRTGAFRAGVVHPGTGELFWAPDGTWRLAYRGWGLGTSAVGHAFRAGRNRAIAVPFGAERTMPCIPFLLEHDLAACFGATTPPPVALDLATIKEVPGVRPRVDPQRPDPVGLASTSDSGAGGATAEGAIDGGVLLARLPGASGADDPWKTPETTPDADGLPSDLHVNSMRMHGWFADGQIERGDAAGRPQHEWHKAINAEAWGPPPDLRPDASARHLEAEPASPHPPFDPRPADGTDTVGAVNDAIRGTPRGHFGGVRREIEVSIENADHPVPSSTFVGTNPDPDHDVARRDRGPAGLCFRGHKHPTTMPAAVGPELNSSSIQVATGPVPSRGKRKTGKPARADHHLFPKAQEWLSMSRSFESVAEFCDELSDWLKEAHPECSMEPGSIEGAFRRRGEHLLNALCPPVPAPAGTLPNGRPRASAKAERD